MRTSNKNDAKGLNKLALLASAAATAAFVISQTRLMQRLTETSDAIAILTPPDLDEPQTDRAPTAHDVDAVEESPPATNESPLIEASVVTDGDQAIDELQIDEAQVTDHVDSKEDVSLDEPEAELTVETDADDNDADDEDAPPPSTQSGSGRLRFQPPRSARERLHYGLPVRGKRRSRHKSATAKHKLSIEVQPVTPALILAAQAPVALLAPPAAPKTPAIEETEFDAEYVAICASIARDGWAEEAEPDETETENEAEVALQPVAAARTRDAFEDMWWLPAPRLRYILLALAYVAVSAAVGSDPVTLTGAGAHALTTVNSAADFVLLGWILCGIFLILPMGSIAARLLSFATRGKLHAPAFFSRSAIESAGWGMRLLATSAFLAGAVLYTPQALSWALDTEHPVAAVSSSTMEPSLHEGELVLIEGIDNIDDLHTGDIIAFSYRDGIAIRRVANMQNGKIVARADTSPDEDVVVPFNDVTGRVLTVAGTQVKLPLLGNISLLGEKTVEPAPGPLSILP
jgi:signal peptidase I